MNANRILLALLLSYLPASASALTLAQSPLFIASTEPRVMLLASRDHQLSVKAYTDYTDIDLNGTLDTTYKDSITYYGYFDTNKCYTYANNRFEPAAAVTTGTHQCNGSYWSGNFMNWASMTRMDVLRKTLYGGYRVVDDPGNALTMTTGVTVLERQFLPKDAHAFAKVFNPGSNATLTKYIPSSVAGANASVSLCNVSDSSSTLITGLLNPLPTPLIKLAAGLWPNWDITEVVECQNTGLSTQPAALLGTYYARIKVCDPAGGDEPNCKTYTHPSSGAQTVKPVGLLQQYGDVDVNRRVRFGLMTGSYAKSKHGGVLRKNVRLITNNNNREVSGNTSNVDPTTVCSNRNSNTTPTTNDNSNDEIDVCTGQFINQDSDDAGIINTFNRLHIAQYQYSANKYSGTTCNEPYSAPFSDGQCVDWGNPLGEAYFETLRYFADEGSPLFDANDTPFIAIPKENSWTDPLPSTQWCALSSIVVLSTGLSSFDTPLNSSPGEFSNSFSIDPLALTHTLGDASHENINGGNYLFGSLYGGSGTNINNQCTAKSAVTGESVVLDNVQGICPESPSMEGGYGIAGLAYAPKTQDLRPSYATQRDTRWGTTGINKDWALRQPITTYAVQLAETLPSFSVAVGSGTVTFLPACQTNRDGINSIVQPWPNVVNYPWRNCSFTNLTVDDNVAMASVGTDNSAKTKTCSGTGTTSRCFTIAWENATWGNDYDRDIIQRLGYCVGAECNNFKMVCPSTASGYATVGPFTGIASDQIRISTCALSAGAGQTMTIGYTLTGTTSDGPKFPILRPGPGTNDFVIPNSRPAAVYAVNSTTYTQGTSSAKLLKNPLWYAAKYGGFTESDPENGEPNPDEQSEWDDQHIDPLTGKFVPGADGDPDNYFNIRNPANLVTALSNVFDRASQPDASAASVATNSTNLKVGSRIFQAKFSSADWSGQLLSYKLSTEGVLATNAEWDAGQIINSQTNRVIITKGATGDGVAFDYGNLTGPTATVGTQQDLLDRNTAGIKDTCGKDRVNYLRGDGTNEGASGTFPCLTPPAPLNTHIGKFRERKTSKLGDIANSNPWYVGTPAAGFSDVDYPGYNAFRELWKERKPVVYVGGNDGMLHAFDASLDFNTDPAGVPTLTSGSELLAYIPSAVFPNLSKLTGQTYNKNHHYFVDGSPMTADVDLSATGANWRTVLVGAMGAGGKGYYALDITDPLAFSEGAAANTLLWEFDETDMGYVYNLPPTSADTTQAKQIVKMKNGKWAVILGNGYNSSLGKAVLYVLFIADGVDGNWIFGTDYIKIVADAADPDNGLSTPIPLDTDHDGYADTIYAGDLKGHIWKFDVSDNDPSSWQLALGAPLFTATDGGGLAQPIVSPPELTPHPNGGLIIMFGTGKYIEPLDNTSTASQTFYAIWDNGATLGSRAAELLQQTVTNTITETGGNYRTTSQNAINWRNATSTDPANCSLPCTATHKGWYMDLPTNGERIVGIPTLINKAIYFNTLIPSDAPCDAGGTGFLMKSDYQSGGQVNYGSFDTNGDGKIDANDTNTGGYQVGAALGGTTFIQQNINSTSSSDPSNPGNLSTPNIGVGVSALTTGALGAALLNYGPSKAGRLSWRELVQ